MPTECTCVACGVLIRMVPTHCRACYQVMRQERSRESLEARAWARLDRNGPLPERRPELGRCWVWTGATNRQGYGHLGLNGKHRLVHRVTWESVNGAIPAGLHLDHLCRTRLCARPDHLEPVTAGENMRRGDHPSMITFRTGICRRGHGMTADNTAYERGGRRCKQCHSESARRRYTPKPRNVARGERAAKSSLTESTVRAIRAAVADGVAGAALAREYGVTKGAIYAIVKRRTWAHVYESPPGL